MKKLLILALLGASPAPEATPSPFFIDLGNVEYIDCVTASGSGVRIDNDLVLTADHVVAHRACSVDGQPVEVVHEDGVLDIAVVRTKVASETRFSLSCDGFRQGKSYYAVGWAFGRSFVVQRLTGTGSLEKKDQRFTGESILRGHIFPGMSGGAIVDEEGLLVGLVNAGNPKGLSLSRSLDQTFLCKG